MNGFCSFQLNRNHLKNVKLSYCVKSNLSVRISTYYQRNFASTSFYDCSYMKWQIPIKQDISTKKLDGTKWYTVHMQRSFRKSNNTFPNLLPGGRKLSLEFRQNSSHYVTNRRLSNFLCQSRIHIAVCGWV